MKIGIISVELELAYILSIKEKRKILTRVKDRVRNKFNVSIAEVDGNDSLEFAVLGIVMVANEQKFVNRVLCKVIDHIESIGDCVIADYSMEFLSC